MVSTLEITQVSISFKNDNGSVHVLDQLDLSVKDGEFVTIIGPSGCSKSTLLKLIAGLYLDFQGHIESGSQEEFTVPPRIEVLFFKNIAYFLGMGLMRCKTHKRTPRERAFS